MRHLAGILFPSLPSCVALGMSMTPLHLSFLIVTVILTTLWNSDHCAHFRIRLELKSRVGNRVSEQMPVVGLGSEKLVPSPALLAQWRDAEAFLMPHLPREALVQDSPQPLLPSTSSLPPRQEGRAPIPEGQQITGIGENTT